MTTVKVKFRPSTVEGRPGTLVYLVTHRRITKLITTAYKVYSNEWDEDHSKLVSAENGRTSFIQSVKGQVHSDMVRLDEIINRFEYQNISYTSDDVAMEFCRSGKDESFFDFMEGVINRLKQLNHQGTSKNYSAALCSFRRFRGGEDIRMYEIDQRLMEDYQAYLKSAGLAPNSISFYMRILRAVYNRAVEQNLVEDKKPFRKVFTGIEKTQKRAISANDIKRIRNLDLRNKPDLEFARDIFMFLFFCRGMSFIDAAFLKKTDIQNGVLAYRRHKTGQLLHIKLIRQIKEIIDRYPSDRESPYLLRIIARPGKNERPQYESALHSVNKSLKTIAEMAKLPVRLTTYVTRHTWATIAKSKNVPVSVISDALGHDSIATTQIYLASFDVSVIDKVNELIIKDL